MALIVLEPPDLITAGIWYIIPVSGCPSEREDARLLFGKSGQPMSLVDWERVNLTTYLYRPDEVYWLG